MKKIGNAKKGLNLMKIKLLLSFSTKEYRIIIQCKTMQNFFAATKTTGLILNFSFIVTGKRKFVDDVCQKHEI